MEAAIHHNKRIWMPRLRAAAGGLATLGLVLLPGVAPLHAATWQRKSTDQSTRASKHPTRPPSVNTESPGYARLLASHDVDVGKFYMNKGKYDAAISRFDSAVTHDPGWAIPHELLGETYEKKDDLQRAITEYRKYLKIKPYAKDASKIQKRVEKLHQEIKEREAEEHQARQISLLE